MILCLETATSVCSVALAEGENIIAFRQVNEDFKHAEKLTVFISEVLEEAGKQLSELDAIAISSGPGSYTGLRIGVSVAKGLCFALDKPLISISTLEAMAAGAIEELKVNAEDVIFCPMIDARRLEAYCALYDGRLNCIYPPSPIIITEDFFAEVRKGKKIFYFGDGAEKCKIILSTITEFIFQEKLFPSAKFMAGLAFKKFSMKQFENLALFEPVYLKEFQPGVGKNDLKG